MIGIILTGHGNFATGMMSSVKLIAGTPEHFKAVDFPEGDSTENLAKNLAYKVKRTKRPVTLEPMNPYERRVIHSALQNDKYVSTHSEGEEPFRRVVITLNK